MATRISVFNSKELQGTILLMKGAPREVAKEIRQRTKAMIDPVFREAIQKNASTKLEKELAVSARVAVSDQNVTLSVGSVGKKLSGGGTVKQLAPMIEFGATKRRQFGPRNRRGNVFFPTVAQVIPRVASLWVQTTIKTFYEILERR